MQVLFQVSRLLPTQYIHTSTYINLITYEVYAKTTDKLV